MDISPAANNGGHQTPSKAKHQAASNAAMSSSVHFGSPSPDGALSPLTQSLMRPTAKKLSTKSPKRATSTDARKMLISPLPKKSLFSSNLPVVGEEGGATQVNKENNFSPLLRSTPNLNRFSSIGTFKTYKKVDMRMPIPHIIGGKKKPFQTERKARRNRHSTTSHASTNNSVSDGGFSDFLKLALDSKSLEVQKLRKEVNALRPAKEDLEAQVLRLVSEKESMAVKMMDMELVFTQQLQKQKDDLKQLPVLVEMNQQLKGKVTAQDAKLKMMCQQLVDEKETMASEVNSAKEHLTQQIKKQEEKIAMQGAELEKLHHQLVTEKKEFAKTLAKHDEELEELRQFFTEKNNIVDATHQDSLIESDIDLREGKGHDDASNGSDNMNGAGNEPHAGNTGTEDQEDNTIPRPPPQTDFGLLSPNSVGMREKALQPFSKQSGKRKVENSPKRSSLPQSLDREAEKYPLQRLKLYMEVGEEVVAEWRYPDGTTSWERGVITSHKDKPSDCKYGPIRYYDIEYHDGYELSDVKDVLVFPKRDYEITMKIPESEWKGVKMVVDEASTDAWARIVGYYVATINGEEKEFPRLYDAMKAHDAFIFSSVPDCKALALNLPEEFIVIDLCSDDDGPIELCMEEFEVGQNAWVVIGKTDHAAAVQAINAKEKIAMVKWASSGKCEEVDLDSIRPMHKNEARGGERSSSRYSRRNRRQTNFFVK